MNSSPSRLNVERVIARARQHWAVVVLPTVVYGLLAAVVWVGVRSSSTSFLFCIRAAVIGLGGIAVLLAILDYVTTSLIVTDKRIALRTGLLRRQDQEILLGKIESIDVRQPPLGTLLGYGTMAIIGTGGTSQAVRALARPFKIRDSIYRALEASRAQAVAPS